jgi:hypothetical protein
MLNLASTLTISSGNAQASAFCAGAQITQIKLFSVLVGFYFGYFGRPLQTSLTKVHSVFKLLAMEYA